MGGDVRVRQLVHHTSGLTDRDHSAFPGLPVTGCRAGQRRQARRYPAPSKSSPLPRAPRTGTRTAATTCWGTSSRASPAGPLPISRAIDCSHRSACATPSSETHPRRLPPNAARGHFEAVDGKTYVEPARSTPSAPGGSGRRPSDLAHVGRSLLRHGFAATAARAPRQPRRRDADPLRVGPVGPHASRAADPQSWRLVPGLELEDGAVPDRANDGDRAREHRAARRELRWPSG